jgi:Arc/MetJ-type ribon-helix-helix transcriptional regulator
MARVFAYLMSHGDVDLSDEGIFQDTSETIRKALADVRKKNEERIGITQAAFQIALNKLL